VADIKAPLYTSDGTSKGEIKLDAEVFGIEPNLPVLHQVITAQLAAKRSGTPRTPTSLRSSGESSAMSSPSSPTAPRATRRSTPESSASGRDSI